MENIYGNSEVLRFLVWEQATRDTIDFKKIYVDIVDDLVTGLLLSQLVYWYLPNEEGKTKLRVKKNNELWLAKKREDWYDEIRITPKQVDRSLKILVSKGLVKKDKFKFNGNPTIHLQLNLKKLTELVDIQLDRKVEDIENAVFNEKVKTIEVLEMPLLTKGEKGNHPKVKKEIDQRVNSLTENTTEITTEILNQSISHKEEGKNDGAMEEIKINIINGSEESVKKIAISSEVVEEKNILDDFKSAAEKLKADKNNKLTDEEEKELEDILYNSEVFVHNGRDGKLLESTITKLYKLKVLKVNNENIYRNQIRDKIREINLEICDFALRRFRNLLEDESTVIKNKSNYFMVLLFNSIDEIVAELETI